MALQGYCGASATHHVMLRYRNSAKRLPLAAHVLARKTTEDAVFVATL